MRRRSGELWRRGGDPVGHLPLAVSSARVSPARRLPAPPEVNLLSASGQSVVKSGGRWSVPRRSGQRSRADGSSRTVMLQCGDPGDAYHWGKYGQKVILGAKFARNYYRCEQRSGCSAMKHVQQSDDDTSRLEITYIGEHTCGDRPPSPATKPVDDTLCNTATSHLPAAAAAPSALQKFDEHVPASDDMMACTPSMEEMVDSWLFIPSPACSQPELLSEAEVPELRQDASPADPVEVEEHRKPCNDEFLALHDSVVPDFT